MFINCNNCITYYIVYRIIFFVQNKTKRFLKFIVFYNKTLLLRFTYKFKKELTFTEVTI